MRLNKICSRLSMRFFFTSIRRLPASTHKIKAASAAVPLEKERISIYCKETMA